MGLHDYLVVRKWVVKLMRRVAGIGVRGRLAHFRSGLISLQKLHGLIEFQEGVEKNEVEVQNTHTLTHTHAHTHTYAHGDRIFLPMCRSVLAASFEHSFL